MAGWQDRFLNNTVIVYRPAGKSLRRAVTYRLPFLLNLRAYEFVLATKARRHEEKKI
jgi:hypothetical protein